MTKYVKWPGKNFGDELNNILFERHLGVRDHVSNGDELTNDVFILGIGTILNGYLNQGANAEIYVFGSGAGNTPAKPKLSGTVLFVRGPLTCNYLGIKQSHAITDGAYALTGDFQSAGNGIEQSSAYGLVPHHWSIEKSPEIWQEQSDVKMISPHLDFNSFVESVASCGKIVSECLHGAIAADILGIPFAIIQTTPVFHSFKWLDWAESLCLPMEIQYFDPANYQKGDLNGLHFINSRYSRRNDATIRISDKLLELKAKLARS